MANQIVPTNGNGNHQLAQFGARDQIREMADRLKTMMPGTTTFTAAEALTVAQVAIAHGLDPFNGEVWGLKGDGKWYGVMVGIKGLRKSARRQAQAEGGTYWTEPPTRVEPKKYGQPDNVIVYETVLRDTVTMQAYGKSLSMLLGAGIPYADAIGMIGKAPQWIGVGIVKPDERSKMNHHALARKRAEAEAIRQRYDVSLVGVSFTETDEEAPDVPVPVPAAEEVTDGTYTEQPQPEPRKATEAELMADLGFGCNKPQGETPAQPGLI